MELIIFIIAYGGLVALMGFWIEAMNPPHHHVKRYPHRKCDQDECSIEQVWNKWDSRKASNG